MQAKVKDEIKFMFDKISKKYDFMNNLISFGLHMSVKRKAVKSLNIQPNSKILDLCCGSGDMAGIIKQLCPSCDVVGVDFSNEMLDLARKKHPNVTFWEMDALNLKFEKNSFDYVIMGFGLRNISEKNKVLQEIYKVLKSNGKFLHLDFGKRNKMSFLYDNIVLWLVRFFTKNSKPYKYLILSKNKFLSPDELIELFKFNKLEYQSHKNMFFDMISFQVTKKVY